MNNIYNMDMSFKFLIQATRVLHINNYDDQELKMVFDYIVSIDNEELNSYFETCTILGFKNDLELYMDIISSLIYIYEDMEEYEKCYVLKKKNEECIQIINKNKN